MSVPRLIDDPRPIKSAWAHTVLEGCDVGAEVGYQGTTRIVPYEEVGQMALLPWLAVYKGDHLASRLNAAEMAEIRYVEVQP